MERKKVTKAIIVAAGFGTRFLPQTKAMPKEMLPIMGKPIIQWVVEELVAVGITDIIMVTGAQKRALEDHFDRSYELEEGLLAKGKTEAANEIKEIAGLANFVYIRQKEYNGHSYGTAVPMMNAEHLIRDEPFFFVSADDLFVSEGQSRAKQMLDAYEETGKSVVASLEINPKDSEKYGMIDISEKKNDSLFRIGGLIEKPKPEETPSNFMTIMWYLVTPNIFDHARKLKAGKGGELHAPDAINSLAKEDEVYAKVLSGTYHDCGNYMNYLKASIHFASQYDEEGQELKKYIEEVLLNKKK